MEQTKNTTRRAKATAKVLAFLKNQGVEGASGESVRMMLRERAVNDFWFFQHHIFGNLDTLTELHMDLCRVFQKRHRKGFSLYLLPRSHLKTSVLTEAGILWCLIRNPHSRHLVINAKLDNAVDIVADIRKVVETNEIFRWLFPEYCPDLAPKALKNRCKWLTDRLDFPCSRYAGGREGNVQAMGVEASLVSKHYDYLWFDDAVNDINTATKEYRDKIWKWYLNVLQLRHDLTSPCIIIGTRWHFDDLYSRLYKREKAERKKAIAAGKKVVPTVWIYHRQVVEKVDFGGEMIAGYDNVQPIWPERFNKLAIEELKSGVSGVGSYIFSCQYMNNPLPEEDAIFKLTDIKPIDEFSIPDNVIYFMACDAAVEETTSGDYWVITVAAFDVEGKMYVREIVRDKLLTSSFLRYVYYLNKKYQPFKVGVETVAFQKTLFKTYTKDAASSGQRVPWIEMKRGNSTKRSRILGLQPRVERGDFYYEDAIKNSDWLLEEMTTYPKSTHDDILDTLADLEALYYSAPEAAVDIKPRDTYAAIYGDIEIEDSEEPDEAFSSDLIGSFDA